MREPPPASRRADIQGLRGLAIGLVVAFHAGLPVPGGYGGVDVFFVISGFVITGMLAREWHRTGRVGLRRFYARRVIRLLPASALALTCTVVASALVEPPFGSQQQTASTGAGGSLFGANLVLASQHQGYFDRLARINPLVHLWSLGVEEQFYALLPVAILTCLVLAGRRPRTRWWVWAVGAASAASVTLFLAAAVAPGARLGGWPAGQLAFYLLPARTWELGTGVLLAAWAGGRQDPLPHAGRLGAAGALAVGVAALAPGLAAAGVSVVSVTGAAALLAAGHRRPAAVLGAAPLVALGDRSYSWYLWHWPAIVLTGVLVPDSTTAPLVAAAGSLAVAWVAARVVEDPVRRSFPRRARPVALLTLSCVAVPLSASAVLGTAASAGWGQPRLAELVRSSRVTTLGRALDCLATGTPPTRAPARCTRVVTRPRGTIVLVGDSHADSLSDGVVRAGNGLGYDVALRAGRACPLSTLSRFTTSQIPRCPDYVEQVLREIERVRPALVVVAHSSWEYEQELRGRGDPEPDRTWALSLLTTVQRIRASGARVLVVQDVPRLGLRPVPCRFGAVRPVECSVTRASVTARQGAVASAERRALAGLPGVWLADPTGVLCGPLVCDAIRGDRLQYADNQHLNSYGSLRLAPALAGWMGVALRLSRS